MADIVMCNEGVTVLLSVPEATDQNSFFNILLKFLFSLVVHFDMTLDVLP